MPRVVSFIAVALATAICLFPQIHSVAGSVVVAVLAIVALILGRLKPGAHQTAALFLIGVAAIDLVTFAAASQVGSNLAQRSAIHVDRDGRRSVPYSILMTIGFRAPSSTAARCDRRAARGAI